MAYDSARQRVVMFGGENSATNQFSDTWEYNGATSRWTQRNVSGPAARRNPVLVYDPVRAVTVLFGGEAGTTASDQTWEWDGTAWTQRSPAASPSARHSAGGAWDPVRQRVVIFGGEGSNDTIRYNDVHEWDGTTWTQRTGLGTPPSARLAMGLAYDVARSRLVMACGSPRSTNCDTWELGTSWQQITTNGDPSARIQVAFAYDVAVGRSVMTGGQGSSASLASSIEFDGTDWAASGSTPTARGWARMVYDSTRGKLVLFGGYGGGAYLSDTWEY